MPRVIVRETSGELPSSTSALGGLFEGDLAIALDTDTTYYWNGSVWVQLAAAPVLPGVTSVSADHVVTALDYVILVDASGGDVTVSLPAASAQIGRWLEVKKIDDSVNKVIIDAAGADLIDGDATLELLFEDEAVPIVSDGVSEWSVL
jgi:hypothetical protein